MRAVNLLPRDAQMRKSIRDEDPAVVVGSALAVVVVIALGAGFVTAHNRAGSEQQKLAAARADLGRVSAELQAQKPKTPENPAKPTKPILPVPAVTAEVQPRLAAVAQALSTRIAWDRVLREFSLVVPSDVSVTSLSMKAPDPSAAQAGATVGTGTGFVLSGLAYSHDSVARLLARLMLVPDIQNVTLASSNADSRSGSVTFSIDADVKGAPEAAATTTPAATAPPATTTTGATQ